MKALILAGGYGTRLGELTKNTPKPLIKIGNKSVLQHIIDRLNQHGINQIIVKVHYLPDKIIQEIGDQVMYYYEPVLYTHFETISRLKTWLKDDDFMVINGDTINDVNYTEMINKHRIGQITELVDEWRCAGTWIYPKGYFDNQDIKVIPYRPKFNWFDIGTLERLQKAREFFEV